MDYEGVHIIWLARNGMAYLKNTLGSLLSQTYPKPKTSIFFFTHDNQDQTPKLLQKFVKLHSKAYKKIDFFCQNGLAKKDVTPHYRLCKTIGLQMGLRKRQNAKYIIVWDSDCWIPTHTIEFLYKQNKDIMCIDFPHKNNPYMSTAYIFEQYPYFRKLFRCTEPRKVDFTACWHMAKHTVYNSGIDYTLNSDDVGDDKYELFRKAKEKGFECWQYPIYGKHFHLAPVSVYKKEMQKESMQSLERLRTWLSFIHIKNGLQN